MFTRPGRLGFSRDFNHPCWSTPTMDPPSSSRLSVSLHADVNSFHLANKNLAGRNITFQILVSICFYGFFPLFLYFCWYNPPLVAWYWIGRWIVNCGHAWFHVQRSSHTAIISDPNLRITISYNFRVYFKDDWIHTKSTCSPYFYMVTSLTSAHFFLKLAPPFNHQTITTSPAVPRCERPHGRLPGLRDGPGNGRDRPRTTQREWPPECSAWPEAVGNPIYGSWCITWKLVLCHMCVYIYAYIHIYIIYI